MKKPFLTDTVTRYRGVPISRYFSDVWKLRISKQNHRSRIYVKHEVYVLDKPTIIFRHVIGYVLPVLHLLSSRQLTPQEAFEKCWAHSPLRAAARPFTSCRCRTPLRIDVHDDNANDNDNAWQREPLWPHRMGPMIQYTVQPVACVAYRRLFACGNEYQKILPFLPFYSMWQANWSINTVYVVWEGHV